MDPKKIQALREWAAPKSVKEVQRFLGFANFYRKFIRGFSSVVAPLSALTKKDGGPFRLNIQAELSRILSSGSLQHQYWFSLTHHSLLLLRLTLQMLGLGLFFLNAPLENGFFSHCLSPTESIESIVRKAEQEPDPGTGSLFVPQRVHAQVFQWGHSSHLMAHPGIQRTLEFLRRKFWWSEMEKETRAPAARILISVPKVCCTIFPSLSAPGHTCLLTSSPVCLSLKVTLLFLWWSTGFPRPVDSFR